MCLFRKQPFLAELIDRNDIITSNTKSFLRLNEEDLNFKTSSDVWSIAEIFEHLNIINKAYITDILKKIFYAKDADIDHCSSGWLGDLIYEKMLPRADGSVYKAKSPKNYNAKGMQQNTYDIFNDFIEHQNEMYDILQHAFAKNLDRIIIPFYFSKFLKFNLCDTLRFIIAHNERHLLQAYKVMEKIPLLQNG